MRFCFLNSFNWYSKNTRPNYNYLSFHLKELKQEIKPLPSDYGRSVHHPAMHHPSAWQPPVTGAYLGMGGTNSGTNSPSPVHGLQHPAYGMNGKFFLLIFRRFCDKLKVYKWNRLILKFNFLENKLSKNK